jgi:hypothetical protein
VNEEWVTLTDDGRRALMETVKTPLFDDAGQLLGVLGMSRDITGRQQAEREIKKLAKFPGENPYPVIRVAKDGILDMVQN